MSNGAWQTRGQGNGAWQPAPPWRGPTQWGSRAGSGQGTAWAGQWSGRRWRCSQCNCNKNIDSWMFCKHCGAERQGPAQWPDLPRHPGPQFPPGGGAGGNGLNGSVGGDSLSADELRQLITLCEKGGDMSAANKHKQALDKLTKSAQP
eukprot:1068459-Pyramimonas_sp.AAC.1